MLAIFPSFAAKRNNHLSEKAVDNILKIKHIIGNKNLAKNKSCLVFNEYYKYIVKEDILIKYLDVYFFSLCFI